MKRHAFPALALAAAIPCAVAAVAEPAGISNPLRAPAGEQLDFVLNAHGAQLYVCRPRPTDRFAFQWTFLAPEATLLQDDKIVGYHGAGPVWESMSDGSSVRGEVRERQDGGAGNLPWLLLAGTPSQVTGRFAGVTSIQRVATHGGVEPKTACDASMSGREARVKYTADYYFYKRRPSQVSSNATAAY
jgi:Protein of unknown function (DUF3455)